MKSLILIITIMLLLACSRKPENKYVLEMKRDSLAYNNLLLKPEGKLMLAENDTVAYQLALTEFYKAREAEIHSDINGRTRDFTVLSLPEIKDIKYRLGPQTTDSLKRNLFLKHPEYKSY